MDDAVRATRLDDTTIAFVVVRGATLRGDYGMLIAIVDALTNTVLLTAVRSMTPRYSKSESWSDSDTDILTVIVVHD